MNFGKLLKSIFSITKYNETHDILRVMGLKIKYPNREFSKKIKESQLSYYKKNNMDIRTIPPASGQLREIQLANLELLKEFDRVCRENNLEYWFDYGSTLGAIRHKGYIPWDDDIDIGMIRENYEKIIDIFNSSTNNPNLIAEYNINPNNSMIIKIKHKDSSFVFIDIFPFDLCSETIAGKNPIATTSKIKKMCKKVYNENKNATVEELREAYKNLRLSVLGDDEASDKNYVMRGVDFCGFPKNWFYKYETIYPIKQVEFEGGQYSCLNNTDEFLTSLYGNYMGYPKKIGVGHTAYIEIDDNERNIIKNIITERS